MRRGLTDTVDDSSGNCGDYQIGIVCGRTKLEPERFFTAMQLN